ncbi:MAG TPA: hypothetical protein VGF95_00050 [Solirubrobacteraceae bacterium]|jgi:hypothetical protein
MWGIAKRQVTLVLACSAALMLAAASAYGTSHESGAGQEGPPSPSTSKALGSPQLWATIDICKTSSSPVVGVRGSMPSDGNAHDVMYMRFGVQYLDASTSKWAYLSKGAETGFTKVGLASATRQAGRNFQLTNPPEGKSFELRGLIEFQWRHGSKVVLTAIRPTTSGHKRTVLHAEPPGFSVASCKLD